MQLRLLVSFQWATTHTAAGAKLVTANEMMRLVKNGKPYYLTPS